MRWIRKHLFATSIIALGLLSVLFVFVLPAHARVYIDGQYDSCDYTIDPDGCDDETPPKGDYCYNGPNANDSGNCGTPCGAGEPWSKYKAECKLIPEGDYGGTCKWVYVKTQEYVCSTADKCIAGETGLRAGRCDCSYGGLYKICCNGATPVNCTNYSIQDPVDPPEGVCPAGAATVFCNIDGNPACSANDCAVYANTGNTGGGDDGGTTPTPTPTPGSSGSGCFETGEPVWLEYPNYRADQGGIQMMWYAVTSVACGWCKDADGGGQPDESAC